MAEVELRNEKKKRAVDEGGYVGKKLGGFVILSK
jgi:hypothetical protein